MTFVSYAINREDYRLFLALGHVDQGRYLDFSRPEDCQGSVSQAFYERGWTGICHFEPGKNRQRDRFFAGSLPDLVDCEPDWLQSSEIHFLAVDTGIPATSLKAFFDRSHCRPWLVVVRDQQVAPPNDDMAMAFTDAGYAHQWTDGVNHFWVIGARSDLAAHCFKPLTHRDPVISHELLELRVQYRLKTILADELARTSKKLSAREKEIEQLNQGLASTRQAYDGAMLAYETVLAYSNQLPIRVVTKMMALPQTLLRQSRLILVKSIRWPALKALAYLEQRPLMFARFMNGLKQRPVLEKVARKLIGKPKLVVPIPRQADEPCPAMTPDEIKAYQQIIGS